MSWFMVDVETDGPCPGLYSMIEVGCVRVEPTGTSTISSIQKQSIAPVFYAKLRPTGERYDVEALKVSGHTRDETADFPHPQIAMADFAAWIVANNVGKRAFFISDNNGFDWQFVNYYFHLYVGHNPFGHSSTNLGSLYKGQVRDATKNFKHLRQTKHTHNPVDDARGNIEALQTMIRTGLVFPL